MRFLVKGRDLSRSVVNQQALVSWFRTCYFKLYQDTSFEPAIFIDDFRIKKVNKKTGEKVVLGINESMIIEDIIDKKKICLNCSICSLFNNENNEYTLTLKITR